MDHKVVCKCGKNEASFMFKNEVMPPETIEALYCPECSGEMKVNEDYMLKDNDWLIHFDMEVTELYKDRLPYSGKEQLSPELLFDEGYVSWRGIYPGDHLDSIKEREEISALAKTDPAAYFKKIRTWAIDRMNRLKEEGWRKAYEG
jgi:hypothetical protein